ncbi:MAG: VCBS repeat-containing protein, partial [Myxococcales bacterium]|nr:VCBS repeat-containing protein [Myxococcales bacterium]
AMGGTAMHSDLVDIDHDGNLDLLVATTAGSFGANGRVLVYHGAGDGSFPEVAEYEVGLDPWWVVAGDLNGDGHLDLAVADYGGSTVSIMLGNSHGAFSAREVIDVCWGPQSVAIGDMNNDGANDLVIGCMDSDTVELRVQAADGKFELVRWWGTGSRPVSVKVADLNMDGVLDVAWANQLSNSVGMALSEP